MMAGYKVSVATASLYGFALRKIIESVAAGCIAVTNLPESDVLPEIDGALWRVSQEAKIGEVEDAVAQAEAAWDLDAAIEWSKRACRFYDWRAVGQRLSDSIEAAA